MAIACDTCGKPVHEQTVRCPHCGDLTGVPVDPRAADEVSLPAATALDLPADDPPLEARVASAIVEVVSHAIGAAVGLVKPDEPDDALAPSRDRAPATTRERLALLDLLTAEAREPAGATVRRDAVRSDRDRDARARWRSTLLRLLLHLAAAALVAAAGHVR